VGHTFAEKVLARNAGLPRVQSGQVIDVFPDLVLSHDNTAAIVRIFREIGVERVKHPQRLAVTLDHAVPAPTTQHAQNHAEIRRFVAEQGILHFFEIGRGICHQVLCEEGLVQPGHVVLGADSHSTHYGALGAFGAGIGRSEVAAIWATGRIWLRVPESIKITVDGKLAEWTSAKDIALYIIGTLGADAGTYASLEFHGPAISALSMESRFVLPNMMAEMGVKNAWIAPDQITLGWLGERKSKRITHQESRIKNLQSPICYPTQTPATLPNTPSTPPRWSRKSPVPTRWTMWFPYRRWRGPACNKPFWVRAPTADWRTSPRRLGCWAGRGSPAAPGCSSSPPRHACCKLPCAWATSRHCWRQAPSSAHPAAARVWVTTWGCPPLAKSPSAPPTATSKAEWAPAMPKFTSPARPWSQPVQC